MRTIEEIKQIVEHGCKILMNYGYKCNVSAEELVTYFEADTYEEDLITLDDVLKNQLLVIHELVEITELKKRGLKITKDVIVKNYELVYEAHLIATEIELEIASLNGNIGHIKNRLLHIQSWLEGPNLPKHLFKKCKQLLEKAKQMSSK